MIILIIIIVINYCIVYMHVNVMLGSVRANFRNIILGETLAYCLSTTYLPLLSLVPRRPLMWQRHSWGSQPCWTQKTWCPWKCLTVSASSPTSLSTTTSSTTSLEVDTVNLFAFPFKQCAHKTNVVLEAEQLVELLGVWQQHISFVKQHRDFLFCSKPPLLEKAEFCGS